MKFTQVIFGDDGITALYDENGKLILFGDEYHDKIQAYIDGFCRGILYSEGKSSSVDVISLNSDGVDEFAKRGDEPPKKWPSKKWMKYIND